MKAASPRCRTGWYRSLSAAWLAKIRQTLNFLAKAVRHKRVGLSDFEPIMTKYSIFGRSGWTENSRATRGSQLNFLYRAYIQENKGSFVFISKYRRLRDTSQRSYVVRNAGFLSFEPSPCYLVYAVLANKPASERSAVCVMLQKERGH